MTPDHRRAEVPDIIDPLDMWLWCRNQGDLSLAEAETVLGNVGRNPAPTLLHLMWAEGIIDGDTVARLVGVAWSSAEYPERYLDLDDWLELFEVAGYTVDGKACERPAEPLTLYRGATREHRSGWSWTDNLEMATKYASGEHFFRQRGQVWTATVEPWRLLARSNDRQEDEYVVDTVGLHVEAWGGEPQ